MRKLTHVEIEGTLYPLPEGHQWLAHDPSGNWYSYKEKPAPSVVFWEIIIPIGSYVCTTTTPKNWRTELYQLY